MAVAPVRVGVIGLGFIGRAHVDALRRVPGVQVAAVAGSRPEIHAQAEALGIPAAYTDYRALLADPSIDVVHTCTPNNLHFAINRATVAAGKACFSEKPLTTTSAEAIELVKLARASGKPVAVNFNHRGFAQVQQARALIAGGSIGDPFAMHGSYLQDWLLYETDWNWRVDPAVGGPSRAVADIGSHWMDLAQHITGARIVEVMADLHTAIPVRHGPDGHHSTFARQPTRDSSPTPSVAIETEDFGAILLRFDNNAHGSFIVSQVSAGRKNDLSLQIDGSRAALAWSSARSEELWHGSREAGATVALRDPATSLVPGLSTLPAGHAEGWNDALHATIQAFYDAFRSGRPAAPWVATWEDGLNAVLLTEAILASHRSRAWTARQETTPTGTGVHDNA